jgi:antitoxin PrlF
VRVTRKGQVTIPTEIRRALGIRPGIDVEFELDEQGARILVAPATREVAQMRGAGNGDLTTDEILSLTRD